MDVLPSNVADFPSQPSGRHRRTARTLMLLAAVIATGGALLAIQTVVGLDQVARSVVSIASTARLPGSEPPESRNWAGYAATGGSFRQVSATWSVPQFAPDSPAGADAIWVGIGGVHGTDLIQAGTGDGFGPWQY
jgi:peptidase A4-like protein